MKTYLSGDPIADRRADYAAMLADAGEAAAAADVMAQALEAAPDWPAGWFRLGSFHEAAGAVQNAADAYREALRRDPEDTVGASLKLALLGVMPLPEAPPAAYVEGLFDQYSDRFDAALLQRLHYCVPQMIEAAMIEFGAHEAYARALDLGCGTGLMGERLRRRVSRLVGVDLSEGMIAKARRKGLYDELHQQDAAGFSDPISYDLVTAADVLAYLGDLSPVFSRVHQLAQPGALFAFTVERHDGAEDYVLQTSMRYAHSRAYLTRLAEQSGFEIRDIQPLTLRLDRGEPVEGWLAVLAARFPLLVGGAAPAIADDETLAAAKPPLM
ncbi:class I SAM-dependent DNA methyltransferase [Consotaella salsifontis]|uniref:Predicted methyltransferase, contains TPR repeat n=1 Tax=Consotaella salsifontis TaxID=1365950 RepID=A0A1T4T3X0_9HYPH|nr:methyltransferase domain-containing protein [Consotaella salsifontis]SKA35116.1 Predicted methyltransferase, contains TPR repeat [Consotaella salsifontis]